jgi:5-methylcytosine-specific restriction endonuclease McrA
MGSARHADLDRFHAGKNHLASWVDAGSSIGSVQARWQSMKAARKKQIFDLVYRRDGGCCVYCGIPVRHRARGSHRALDLATLDHRIPRSIGGPTVPDNLVLACHACNNARGTLDEQDFRRQQTRKFGSA